METPTPPTQDIPSGEQFIQDIEQLVQQQQEPVAALKLAAYAADAMRVLMVFERHANMSKDFGSMLKTVCPDWRNPDSINQPADLIAVVLIQAIAALQKAQKDMEQTISAKRSSCRLRQSGKQDAISC